ncbi:hypothetical protein JX265_006813 [Neoarthrinium moseri]|uniref:Uncharacterized protein n=1 Tax=Neoarthrinium moseri TaxID=1658444 RepID=A0A9P9WKX8_9PEZI|nr:hypothetical protein JX266_006865 [Neoarthrinium moseri]KAI1868834.1 hypothetical protein JX265_006813 [Neoarthrinium moseri]
MVILVQINSASRTDPFDAIREIQDKTVDHIDVVISSAGIAKLNTVEDLPLEELEEVLAMNAFSVLLLYKATLLASPSWAPRLALANVLVVKMGMENDWLITLCIHPGRVQTDMGNMAARAFGFEKAPVTLEQSSKNTAYIMSRRLKLNILDASG